MPSALFPALLLAFLALPSCKDDAPSSWAWAGRNAADAETDAQREAGVDAAADAATADASPADAETTKDTGTPEATPDAVPSGLTTCKSVAHIGDSLTYYTQNSLTAAYAEVGATVQIDAYGGRAIKQKVTEDPRTGKQAAIAIAASGFSGCWVVALGTNDTANVAAGAWYSRAEAIDEMMNAIDASAAAPVMWVNTYTTRTTGYYANDNMVLWNEALVEAQQRWSNLKVYDWASVADDGGAPYSDGIHHTSAGYEVRNEAIAQALLAFYPAFQ